LDRKVIQSNSGSLECLLCKERYSREDVLDGTYQLSTLVCSPCYGKMQRKPHEQSCFGKPSMVVNRRIAKHGYSAEAPECSKLCPDRKVCAKLFREPETV
jgi:hypothetical protein